MDGLLAGKVDEAVSKRVAAPANVTTANGASTTSAAGDVVAVPFALVSTQLNESPSMAATTECTVSEAVPEPL